MEMTSVIDHLSNENMDIDANCIMNNAQSLNLEIQLAYHVLMQYQTRLNEARLQMELEQYLTCSHSSPEPGSFYENIMGELNSILRHIENSYLTYTSLHEKVISYLSSLPNSIIEEWTSNGSIPILQNIKSCFNSLQHLVSNIVTALDDIRINIDPSELLQKVMHSQYILFCSAFIIAKHPKQVLKTNSTIKVSLIFLLDIYPNPQTAKCIILPEIEVGEHYKQRASEGPKFNPSLKSSGKITKNSTNFEYNNISNLLSATFVSMKLNDVKRTKVAEKIMEEKYALCFLTTITTNDGPVTLSTLSLPLVVNSHSNQDCSSWATIIWDTMFANMVREPFQVADSVNWTQMSGALCRYISSVTDRSLTQSNLDFLFEKLQSKNATLECITRSQFCKEYSTGCPVPFWNWFYDIAKLIKEALLPLWNKGLIMGFISKTKAEQDLKSQGMGAFLVRFSESVSGAVTLCYVAEPGLVLMTNPWTIHVLKYKSLPDRIRDLKIPRWLHPSDINMPWLERDVAFNEFYTNQNGIK